MQERCPVRVERIAVKPDRISLLVRCASSARYVTDDAAEQVGESFPGIVRHVCLNDYGPTFGDALERTSVPHLMEHLIIELQAQDERTFAAGFAKNGQAAGRIEEQDADKIEGRTADGLSGGPLMGTTEWLDEREGLARIEVSYRDDLTALRAVSTAQTFLNEML